MDSTLNSTLIDWDGRHVPEELRQLPPGRYVVEPVTVPLTVEEEDGICDALDALDAGRSASFEDVMNELEREP